MRFDSFQLMVHRLCLTVAYVNRYKQTFQHADTAEVTIETAGPIAHCIRMLHQSGEIITLKTKKNKVM
jgi:hypothetical protein